jgi:KUP system potassium uptake protein
LLINLDHNKVLHDRVLLLSIDTSDAPSVPPEQQAEVTPVGPGMWQVQLTFGFIDEPNVPRALARLTIDDRAIDPDQVTYFLGRETVVSTPARSMNPLREQLFVMQSRTSASAARFFHLPARRVFEVGTTIEI